MSFKLTYREKEITLTSLDITIYNNNIDVMTVCLQFENNMHYQLT